MRSKDYVVVKVTPDRKAYTFWVVEPEVGISLRADGLPVEPPYVFRNRTDSALTLGAAISAEMPDLIGGAPSPIPPGPISLSSTMSGAGTLSAGATKAASLDALLDAESEMLSDAVLIGTLGAATLSGAGAISINASEIAQVRATFAGVGTAFADVDSHPGPIALSATLSGNGAVSSGVILKGAIRGTLSGAGSVSASANLRERISKTFAGTGTLTVDLLSHPAGIAIGARLNGVGSVSANVQSGTIFNAAASVSGNDVTFTAQTVNLSAASKVFGVEYGDGPGGVYTLSKNGPGTNKNQSITIGLLDGVVPGHQLSWRVYYNLTAGDPYTTRRYSLGDVASVPSGSVNIVAVLAGAGSLSTGTAGNISNVNATQNLGTVTVTFTSAIDLSPASYVAGVEYGDGAGGVYTKSKNGAGAVANQSIAIGPQDDVIQGHTLSYRPYYNLTALDPYNTRVYGEAKTIAVT